LRKVNRAYRLLSPGVVYTFGPEEIWASVPGFPGCEISTHGRVRKWLVDGAPFFFKEKKPAAYKENRPSSRQVRIGANRTDYGYCLPIYRGMVEAFHGPLPPHRNVKLISRDGPITVVAVMAEHHPRVRKQKRESELRKKARQHEATGLQQNAEVTPS